MANRACNQLQDLVWCLAIGLARATLPPRYLGGYAFCDGKGEVTLSVRHFLLSVGAALCPLLPFNSLSVRCCFRRLERLDRLDTEMFRCAVQFELDFLTHVAVEQ